MGAATLSKCDSCIAAIDSFGSQGGWSGAGGDCEHRSGGDESAGGTGDSGDVCAAGRIEGDDEVVSGPRAPADE